MATIYLIRHGRTQWNKEEVFRGQADIPLDDWGREQAAAIGEALKGKDIEATITSPLGRAVETATIASQIWGGIPTLQEPFFTDMDYGEWQGLPNEEVKSRYPQLYESWLTNPGSVAFPGGESLQQVLKRCWNGLLKISRTYHDRSLAIVSHRVINKVLLAEALGAGLQAFWKIRQDTACVNLLVLEGDSFVVQYMNDTCHLKKLGSGDMSDF